MNDMFNGDNMKIDLDELGPITCPYCGERNVCLRNDAPNVGKLIGFVCPDCKKKFCTNINAVVNRVLF